MMQMVKIRLQKHEIGIEILSGNFEGIPYSQFILKGIICIFFLDLVDANFIPL